MRKVIFASELEKAAIDGAVDYDLTRTIHTFAIEKPPEILKDTPKKSGTPNSSKSHGGDASKVPTQIMNKQDMRQFIKNNFSSVKYPNIKLENQCLSGGAANIVSFTPTQEFVRQYFQPESAYKGMLLYHSVGTGKTCTAIATATTSFDTQGYTILWVTRHTLKSDIWKNMFKQVCNLQIQKDLQNGKQLPDVIKGNMRYVSKNWMEPISYKQFSNMLLKKNKIYDEVVGRNGEEDPLRKTLLIIDEAHKIYSPTVAKSEKPNTEVLERMIQNSYDKSGKDSVRVLLMTATPFTEDGMEMIQLLNLLRQKDHFPTDFQEFATEYLNDDGYFTDRKLAAFQDKISGYISYLNRSQDARNFAHPVIQNVYAKMSFEDYKYDEAKQHVKRLQKDIKVLKENLNTCIKQAKAEYAQQKEKLMNDKKAEEDRCTDTLCKEEVAKKYSVLADTLKNGLQEALEKCDQTSLDTEALNAKMRELHEYQKYIPKSKYDNLIKESQEKIKEIREQVETLKSGKGKITECVARVKAQIATLEKQAKAEKKAKDDECKKLPVKERKGCKDKAAEELRDLLQTYATQKDAGIADCNKTGNDGMDKVQLQKTMEEHKDKVKNYKELKRKGKLILKEINDESKQYKKEVKQLAAQSKALNADLKKETAVIKKIKDKKQKAAAMSAFRKNNETTIKKLKELKKEMKELRIKISKNNIKVKNAKISDGRLRLKNISQEYAFAKYCHV